MEILEHSAESELAKGDPTQILLEIEFVREIIDGLEDRAHRAYHVNSSDFYAARCPSAKPITPVAADGGKLIRVEEWAKVF
jgi:hypothetical protein